MFKDHKTKRPKKDHPNLKHWDRLRKSVIKDQGGQCKTCPATAEDYPLDLHHRHYDTFGKERKKDVVILCRMCHDAITSRLRSVREKEEIKHEPVKEAERYGKITYEKPKF